MGALVTGIEAYNTDDTTGSSLHRLVDKLAWCAESLDPATNCATAAGCASSSTVLQMHHQHCYRGRRSLIC
jgi:hypothetical protein